VVNLVISSKIRTNQKLLSRIGQICPWVTILKECALLVGGILAITLEYLNNPRTLSNSHKSQMSRSGKQHQLNHKVPNRPPDKKKGMSEDDSSSEASQDHINDETSSDECTKPNRVTSTHSIQNLLNPTDDDVLHLSMSTEQPTNFAKNSSQQHVNTGVSIGDSDNIKGVWTEEEHNSFLHVYEKLVNKWSEIAKNFVKTRTGQQVACHANKFFKKETKKQKKELTYHKYEIKTKKAVKRSLDEESEQ
jgi:SHAQKYF class myb-like DNA-binding protein